MVIERLDHPNGTNIFFDSKRAETYKGISIDPVTGWGKREDNQEEFHLSHLQLSIVKAIDSDRYTKVQEIFDEIKPDCDTYYRSGNTGKTISSIRQQIYLIRLKIGQDMIERRERYGYRLCFPDSVTKPEVQVDQIPEKVKKYQDGAPVFGPHRTTSIGRLILDPATGWCKRIDDQKPIHLSPKQVSLVRILDTTEWLSASKLAGLYEMTQMINSALNLAFSIKSASVTKMPKEQYEKKMQEITKILETLDSYDPKEPEALWASEDIMRMQISDLRKKIGADMIENKRNGYGYRLAPLLEHEVSEMK